MVKTIRQTSLHCVGWLFFLGMALVLWVMVTLMLPNSPSWVIAVIVGLAAGVMYAIAGREA